MRSVARRHHDAKQPRVPRLRATRGCRRSGGVNAGADLYEVRHDGDVVGPVSLDQIRRGLAAGMIPAGAEARRVTPWKTVALIPMIQPPPGGDRRPCIEIRHDDDVVGPVSLYQVRKALVVTGPWPGVAELGAVRLGRKGPGRFQPIQPFRGHRCAYGPDRAHGVDVEPPGPIQYPRRGHPRSGPKPGRCRIIRGPRRDGAACKNHQCGGGRKALKNFSVESRQHQQLPCVDLSNARG